MYWGRYLNYVYTEGIGIPNAGAVREVTVMQVGLKFRKGEGVKIIQQFM